MAASARSCAICGFHIKSGVATTSVNGGSLYLCPPCITSTEYAKPTQAMTFLKTN